MKQEITGEKGTGNKVEAEILFLGRDEIAVVNLTKDIDDKIIVAGKLGRTALMKSLALDAAGVIVVDIEEPIFEEIEHGKAWEIGENIILKLPLLVVSKASLLTLSGLNGRMAVLDPQEKKITLIDTK